MTPDEEERLAELLSRVDRIRAELDAAMREIAALIQPAGDRARFRVDGAVGKNGL